MENYLIIREFASEYGEQEVSVKSFSNKEQAQQEYNDLVNQLMCDYDGVCNVCDVNENSAEFYNQGYYNEWHDCVVIKAADSTIK